MQKAILHEFPPIGRMPSLSSYCWKVQMALVVKGFDFEVRDTLNCPRSPNPRGKLPFLEFDGQKYEDSTRIVRVLDARSSTGPKLPPSAPFLSRRPISSMIGPTSRSIGTVLGSSSWWGTGGAAFGQRWSIIFRQRD